MKFARSLFISLGLLLAIIALVVGLALLPPIQRWAVLRVAARPGLKLSIAHVSAGFSSVVLTDVQMEQHGLKVQLDRLELDGSFWPLIFSRRLNIQRLVAGGLVVDASHLSRNKAQLTAAGAPAAIPGLLARIKLPFELVLEDCRISGRILLPGAASQSPLDAICEIKGGKFSPGEEGSLRLTATLKNPAADAHVGVLHAQVSLRATQTNARGFSRIMLTAVVDAEGRNLSDQNQLKIITDFVEESTGENYSLSVDTVIQGTGENLLALRASLPAGKNEYAGHWTLKARTAQLEPFFLGLALPDFEAKGEGNLSYSPATRAVGLQGDLTAGASKLEMIDATWRAIGAVKLQTQFDITAAGGVARLSRLNVRLAGENPVLELSASQAAEVDFGARRLRVGGIGTGEVLNLTLQGVPLAWVAPFVPELGISGGMITGRFSIAGDTDRLQLHATQPLHIDQLTITQQGTALFSKAAVTLAMDAVLTDKELQAKFSEFALQTAAGDLVKAQATVAIPVSPQPAIAVQASYSADLPALLAPWVRKGHLLAAGESSFTYANGIIKIHQLTASVTEARGALLFKAAALTPFSFDPAGRRVIEKTPVDLIKISIGRLPLDWLPLSQPEDKLAGVMEPVEFVFKVDGEKLLLRPLTPVKFSDVAVTQDGETVLTGLAVEASPAFEMSANSTILAQTGEVTVRTTTGALLLTSRGEAAQSLADGWRATLNFNLEVPALASQPVFDGAHQVAEGHASGEIRATLGATRQVEARLTVNGLVGRDGGQLLPVANLSFRALVDPEGKMSVQAPLLLDRAGQRSDLLFYLEVKPLGRIFSIDGKLTGERVELADAMGLMGVFSARAVHRAPDSGRPNAAPKITADSVAAWSRFKGQLLLDIKSVTSGKDWSMTGLTGVVTMDSSLISLQNLEATFGAKSQLNAKAGLQFSGGSQPYQLTGDFSLNEFDVGKLLKAVEPGKPPTVEGLFSVTGRFKGNGETMGRTLDQTHGQFDLTSRQGVCRLLQRTTNKVSLTSKAVEIGASMLGSLLGSEKANKAAEKVAGQNYFVDQLAQGIGEFNYDQLSLRLVRDETLNFSLQDISLISPEIRLLGKGSISHVSGKSILDQPMNVTLSLAARGKTEQLLGKLRLVDGTRDEVGYARAKEPVNIGGSLARPDPTGYFIRIALGKLNDLIDAD